MSGAIARGIAVVALLTLPLNALAAPATTAKSFTRHDFKKSQLEFNRRTIPEAYKQVGNRDPKWDKDALALLEGMAIRFTNARAGYIYATPGEPTPEQLLAFAENALKSGCDDPMVMYCHGVLKSDGGFHSEARPLVEKANAALLTSRYPVIRVVAPAGRNWEAAVGTEAKVATWEKLRDAIVAAVATWKYEGLDRRFVLDVVDSYMESASLAQANELAEALLAAPEADPWVVSILNAQRHIKAAWASRGGGWADTVTEEGWRGFFAHLSQARKALLDALKDHPDYVEPARYMMIVAMGAGEQLREDPAEWMARSMAIQIDYEPSYQSYRNCLLPRWGGSVAALRAHANECLKTGRFDTSVPWQMALTFETVINDLNDLRYWQTPGIYEDVKQMADGYARTLGPGKGTDYFKSYQAAIAWRANRYDDAKSVLTELGDRVDTEPFMRVRVLPRLAMSHAYAASGASAEAYKSAELLAAQEKLDEAIAAYKSAAEKAVEAKDPAAHFLKSRQRQLEWEREFRKDDWVDVTPREAEFLGWEQLVGTWKIEADGTLVAATTKFGLRLVMQSAFLGTRFDVEVTTVVPETPNQPTVVGMSLSSGDPTKGKSLLVRQGGGRPSETVNEWRFTDPPKPVQIGNENVIRMRMWDDQLFGFVNEQVALNMNQMDRALPGPKIYASVVAGWECDTGTEIRVKRIRVRRVTEPPPNRR